jgi:hypothetical protein
LEKETARRQGGKLSSIRKPTAGPFVGNRREYDPIFRLCNKFIPLSDQLLNFIENVETKKSLSTGDSG